jgi:peptidoglycan-associated lipoprotein
MRELLIIALFAITASAAELPEVVSCPGWSQHRDCFRHDTIYFGSGSSLLRQDSKHQIAEVASFLKSHPSAALLVEGYCDDRGSEEHNHWLGDRRARSAAKHLVRMGIAAQRIDSISFGEDKPVDSRHSAKARQKNRRVEFVLLTPPKP